LFNAEPEADPGPDFFFFNANAGPVLTFHPDENPDPDPSFQIKAKTIQKSLK
jgi:hypothetical protein